MSEKCQMCGHAKSDLNFADKNVADFESLVRKCEARNKSARETRYTTDRERILRWLLLHASEERINRSHVKRIVLKCMHLGDEELDVALRRHSVYLRSDYNVDEVENALVFAAMVGDPEIISWIFEFQQSERVIRYAIIKAAEYGRLKNVIRIFNLGMSNMDLNYVFEMIANKATQNGYLEIVKWMYDLYLKSKPEVLHKVFNEALTNEHYHIANWIVAQGCDVSETDNIARYSMHIAAKSGRIEVIKWLLIHGCDLHDESSMNTMNSLVHIAADNGHLDLLKWLLHRGCSITDRDCDGATPLHLALKQGHLNCVEFLIHYDESSMVEKSEYANTALHLAAMSGNLQCVKFVLQHGADLNALDSFKSNALHIAAKHLDIVKYLVEQGCDIHLRNSDKKTVLSLAAMYNSLNVVEWLLQETDADINDAVGVSSSWINYSGNDQSEMLKILIHYLPKWDINAVQHNNKTLLMNVSEKIEAVKLLVEHGADVNLKSESDHYTVLHLAVFNKAWSVTEYLINHGANVNIPDKAGNTVMHYIVHGQRDKIHLIQQLIAAGSDVNAKNSDGESVLHLAVETEDLECIKVLISHGADMNAINNENITILQKAAHFDQWDIVKYLVNKQCVNVSMQHYGYLMYHALYFQNLDIIDWIAQMCPNLLVVPDVNSVMFNCALLSDSKLQLKFIKICIKYGADINGVDLDGETILYKLVKNYEATQCLLELGANVNAKNGDGITPLHRLVFVDHNIHIKKLMKKLNMDDDGRESMLGKFAVDLVKSKIVMLLLKFGADVNMKDDSGRSILHIAAANEHSHDIARLLVNHGANVNAQDNLGNTVLHTMYFGELTTFLIEKHANIKIRNRKGETVLHKAAEQSVFCKIEKPVNPVHWLQQRNIQNKASLSNNQVLTSVSITRYLNCLTLLIKNGDVNEKDKSGYTALHHAAQGGNLLAFKCLIKWGAQIDNVTNYGDTVLHHAALEGCTDIVKFIFTLDYQHLLQIKNQDLDSVIHHAVRSENTDVTQLVLQHCMDITSDFNKDELTPLHVAVADNNIDIVKLLVDRNANVFAEDIDNMSPIQLAVQHYHIKILKYLIKHVETKYGDCSMVCSLKNISLESLLHIAANNSNYDTECIETIKYLISHKLVDVNAIDYVGKTALHHVCKEYMFQTITLLVDNGCNVNIQDKKGDTVLHVAVKVGSLEITEYLYKHGANIYLKNQRGNSPIQIAAAHGKIKLVKFFIQNGANIQVRNKKGLSLIHNISNSGGIKLLNYIIERYPNTNIHALTNKKQTPLALVLKYKSYHRIVNKLLQYGVTNKADVFTNTELHIACRYDAHIKEMLSKNADVNIQDRAGNTALHIAVKTAPIKYIKLLVSQFSNLYVYNKIGYNVLHLACCTQDYETIAYLIKKLGVDCVTEEGNNIIGVAICSSNTELLHYLVKKHPQLLLHRNNNGENLMHYCLTLRNQTLRTLKYLFEHGVDIHQTNNDGDSCLHMATNLGKTKVVKYLIRQGIDVNVRNKKGRTPMHIAAEKDYIDVVKLLYTLGGDVHCKDYEGRSVLSVALENHNTSVVRYLKNLQRN